MGHIVQTDEGLFSYEHLVSTIPLPALTRLHPEISSEIHCSSSKVAVFNLGFDSASSFDAHWYYFPDPEVVFYRVGQYNVVRGEDRMNLYVEVGLPSEKPVDVVALRDRVLVDLRKVGFITSQRVIASSQVIIDPAYAHITSESVETVNRLESYLKEQDVHLLGRYARWEYSSIEDCIGRSKHLAKLFK